MGIINSYKVLRLERRIEKWKKEGNRLLTELLQTNNQAFEISEFCKTALDEFLIKPEEVLK